MSPRNWDSEIARGEMTRLTEPNVLGFYTHFEATEVFAFPPGQREPVNVFLFLKRPCESETVAKIGLAICRLPRSARAPGTIPYADAEFLQFRFFRCTIYLYRGGDAVAVCAGDSWHVVFICLDVDQPCAAVNSRELFTIDGHCQSSCTLFLAIRDVSVSRSATRLFHASHDRSGNVSPSNTVHTLNAYNPKLREYVTANHYTDTLAFHAISGHDMIQKFGYRECPRK